MAHNLKVLQWNINGFFHKYNELINIIKKHNPDILILCETRLKPNKSINVPGYIAYRKDRPNGRCGGGVCILHKGSMSSHELNLPNTSLELVACSITIANKTVNLFSAYDPQGNSPVSDFTSISPYLQKSFFFAGDLNAKHPAWGSPKADAQGNKITDWLTNEVAGTILNSGEGTFLNQRSINMTHLDIAICSPDLTQDATWRTLEDGSSDHLPALTTIPTLPRLQPDLVQRWCLKRADWTLFYNDLSANYQGNTMTTQASFSDKVDAFTKKILEAAKKAIPITSTVPGQRLRQEWWNADCEKAARMKNKARKRALRHPADRTKLTDFQLAKAAFRRILIKEKEEYFDVLATKVNRSTPVDSLWGFAKNYTTNRTLTIPDLKSPNGDFVADGRTKGDLLLKHFFQPNPIPIPQQIKLQNIKYGPQLNNGLYNNDFTQDELNNAVHFLKPSAPGPDSINNLMLKHLPENTRLELLEIFNESWKQGIIPDSWKTAKVLPFHKPGKDRQLPSAYRPIALTNTLFKLLERMIHTRLSWVIETNNLLSKHQHGFRRGKGAMNVLFDLHNEAKQALTSGKTLVVAFLDIERAFDGIWHMAISAKLRAMGFTGRMENWINSYMSNRKYVILLNGQETSCTATCGVPQGGILSPTLFSLVIDGTTSIVPKTVTPSLYADDLSPRRLASNLNTAVNDMQITLNNIAKYGRDWSLPISISKSAIMIFQRGNQPVKNVQLTINGKTIPVVRAHTILGIKMDDKLSWKPHVTALNSGCNPRLNFLKYVSKRTKTETLKILYSALLRSKLEWGSELFVSATLAIQERFDKFQNRALRIITGLPTSTAIAGMQVLCNMPPLQLRREIAYLKLMGKSISLETDLGRRSKGLRSPAVATLKRLAEKYKVTQNLRNLDTTTMTPINPPWTKSTDQIEIHDNWLPSQKEAYTSADLKGRFFEKLETLTNFDLHLYTDGSICQGTSAGGFGIFCSTTKQQMCAQTAQNLPICTIELQAILHALQLASVSQSRKIAIFSDSMSAIARIKNQDRNTGISRAIQELAKTMEKVAIVWVPSHCGIPGNETADALANEGSSSGQLINLPVPLTDLGSMLKNEANVLWQELWNNGSTGRLLHKVKPSIKPPYKNTNPKICNKTLFYLRCRRARVPAYLHEIKKAPSPLCDYCNQLGDIEHYLLTCKAYTVERAALEASLRDLGLDLSLRNLLGNDPVPKGSRHDLNTALFNYCTNTAGLKKLLCPD